MAKGSGAESKAAQEGKAKHDGARIRGDNSGDEQRLIRELAELLNETGLSEIEIEKSGLKVRVARTLQRPVDSRRRRRAAAGAPAAAAGSAEARPIPASIPAP